MPRMSQSGKHERPHFNHTRPPKTKNGRHSSPPQRGQRQRDPLTNPPTIPVDGFNPNFPIPKIPTNTSQFS